VDLAFYAGPPNPGWISVADVKRETDQMVAALKNMFSDVKVYGDGDEVGEGSALAKWTIAHTTDKAKDVLILSCGTMPSGLYPFPNLKPDGSVIENFVDAGNIVINIADWFGYMSYEGGVRSPDNGPAGAANIFDIAGLSFGSRCNNQIVNANGKKYIPSLKDYVNDRPWHLEQFKGTDWDVTTFAQCGDNDADPAVAVNKKTGGVIAALIQKAWPGPDAAADNRAEVVIDFAKTWLTAGGYLSLDVAPAGKLATTWGSVKAR
jgi:hypothetical protein